MEIYADFNFKQPSKAVVCISIDGGKTWEKVGVTTAHPSLFTRAKTKNYNLIKRLAARCIIRSAFTS